MNSLPEGSFAMGPRTSHSKEKNAKGLRYTGWPKSPSHVSHGLEHKLRSELKAKEKEIAKLENQVNGLKESRKIHAKQEIKARLKFIALKKRYCALKSTSSGCSKTIVDIDVINAPKQNSKHASEPPAKKRRLEKREEETGEEEVLMAFCDARIKSRPVSKDADEFPLDMRKKEDCLKSTSKSTGLYPDIQKELSILQKEVNRQYEEISQQQEFQQESETASASFTFQPPVFPFLQTKMESDQSGKPLYGIGPQFELPKEQPGHTPPTQQPPDYCDHSFHCVQPKNRYSTYLHEQHNQSQQQQQQQQQQQRFYPKGCRETPQYDVQKSPAVPPYYTIQQYSPPKQALLPTPHAIIHSDSPSHARNSTNTNPYPTPPVPFSFSNTQRCYNTSTENNALPPNYPHPPHRKPTSPILSSHDSPMRRRESQSMPRPSTFGNIRCTSLTRNHRNRPTITVAPRERHFNNRHHHTSSASSSSFCYECSSYCCDFPNRAVYRRSTNDFYNESNRRLQRNEFISSQGNQDSYPVSRHMYFLPEKNTGSYPVPYPDSSSSSSNSMTIQGLNYDYDDAMMLREVGGVPNNTNSIYEIPDTSYMPRHQCGCCRDFNTFQT